MNAKQAKHLSLPDLLEKLGHTPTKVLNGGMELWYKSPFRKEEAPSLHISIGRAGFWIWKDFGDEGGTVIDFALRYAGVSTVSEALAFLDRSGVQSTRGETIIPNLFSFHQQDHREAVENFSADRKLELVEAHPIKNPVILAYLVRERGIPAALAEQYLLEVKYKNLAVGKEFFGFGMLNESSGYEVRVALAGNKFKSAINARDISVIRGSGSHQNEVSIFEGMTDFLSWLVMQGKNQLQGDALIMHSLTSHSRTVAYLRSHPYAVIKTYLDNNASGKQGTEKLKTVFGSTLVSCSEIFAPHADLNDALLSTRKSQHSRRP